MKQSFYDWLKTQQNRPDRIADLAVDVSYDATWPHQENSLAELHVHLKSMHADREVHETLNEAWAEYQQWLRTDGDRR